MTGFLGWALAAASVVVFPGIGDTIREPKWILLWIATLVAPFFLRTDLTFWRRWPLGAIGFFLFALGQPFFFAPVGSLWPFLLGLVSLILLAGGFFSADPNAPGAGPLYWATYLQLGMGALQCLGLDFIFRPINVPWEGAHPLVGFLGHNTVFGAWVAALAWFWWGRGERILFVLCSVAAFATGSAFSLFAWLVGLAAYLCWRRPRAGWVFSLMLLVGAGGAFMYGRDFFFDQGRALVWRMAINAWAQQPLFGYGFESFAREFPRHQGFEERPWHSAHNEVVELLFGGGVVGLSLGLWALSALWCRRKIWWQREENLSWFLALAVIGANSLGNFPLHIAPLSLLAALSFFQLVSAKRAAI